MKYVKAPHILQHVCQRAVPVFLDFFGRDNADRRRRLGDLLLEPGGAPNRLDFNGQQFLDAQIRQVGRLSRVGLLCPITRRRQDQDCRDKQQRCRS